MKFYWIDIKYSLGLNFSSSFHFLKYRAKIGEFIIVNFIIINCHHYYQELLLLIHYQVFIN